MKNTNCSAIKCLESTCNQEKQLDHKSRVANANQNPLHVKKKKQATSNKCNQHTAAVCINVSQLCTLHHWQEAHVAFCLGALKSQCSSPAPCSIVNERIERREAPLVNNGESTATRNTKISYRHQRWRNEFVGHKEKWRTNYPRKQLPLHFVSRSLSMRLCLFRCSPFRLHPLRRATRRSKFILSALVYCGSVF